LPWRATIGTAASGVANNPSLGGSSVGAVVAGNYLHSLQISVSASETYQIVACPLNGMVCIGNHSGPGRPGAKLAAGNGYVFWTDQLSAAAVYAYPDAIGDRTTISNVEAGPDSPAWDGTTLFWVNGGSGRLRKSPYPAPSATDFRDITSSANDMLVDAVNVYWSIYNGIDYDLFAIPKGASSSTMPTRLAHGEIRHLAQTSQGVYWANAAGISGVRKP
jgi:hypothetical protein